MSAWLIGLLLWIAPAIMLALLLAYTAVRMRVEVRTEQRERSGKLGSEAAPADARPGLQSGQFSLDA